MATLSRTADSVGLTSATITYSCDAVDPSDWDKEYTYTRYRYRNPVYSWSFSPGGSASGTSGTKTVSSLTQGAATTISATLTITCNEYYYTREKTEDGYTPWEHQRTREYTLKTETASIVVYTRPGVFSEFDGSKDQLINAVINSTSAANWNTHCGKYLSWKNQANKYGTVTIAFPAGQLITATWFNSLRTACGATETQVPVAVKDVTLITADIFKKLGAAISKS